jgi:pSer/pThr/pTyr-binding forkhead associated (FHA) protein
MRVDGKAGSDSAARDEAPRNRSPSRCQPIPGSIQLDGVEHEGEHVMASKMISFRIFLNDQLVDTRSFDQDVIKIGRLASSHLRLEDASLARMHAVIEVGVDGNVRLIDLGSTTGTRVNGQLIDRNQAMRDGDVIEVGSYRLEAMIADARAVRELPIEARPVAAAPSVVPTAAPRTEVDLSKVEDADTQVAEVVASYARSVLDVAHVGQARSRRSSSIPLMAFGGVLMLGGLGLFGYEVAQPWDEYTSAVAEAHKLRKEAPPAPGLGTGSLGMMLALLGLVPFIAGSMRRRETGLDAYLIGEGDEANFKVRGAGLANPAASTLVSREADGFALAFTPAMEGSVELGGESISLADLVASGRAQASEGGYRYALPKGAKAKVMHGDVRFDVSLVNRGALVAGRGEIDWPFWSYFGGTATVGTAFYLLMRAMPDDALAMEVADAEASARFAAYFHQANEELVAEPVEVEDQPNGEQAQSGETGKRASGSEGKMGDQRSRSTNGAYSVKGPKDAVPNIGRVYDPVASASQAGILGILAASDRHFLANADGGAFTVGNADEDVWGNIMGVEHATAYGTGGLGLVGTGKGGGGVAGGLIGMGNHGLIGHGNGSGGLYHGNQDGKGGVIGFGKRKEKIPEPRVGKGTVTGDIDKDMIRRIVRAHLNEVRSCYNSGLTRNPNLEGRVSIQFSIIGTGKVASSVVQENTTKDAAVADCIAKAVKRWTFPRVGKGGTALVTYPFLLTAH